jgi:hypothetical protein
MSRQLNLSSTQQVVVVKREEETLDTDKISIDKVVDNGYMVSARISFFSSTGLSRELVLWEGQDYINIGQWTDSDVDTRIKELLNVS